MYVDQYVQNNQELQSLLFLLYCYSSLIDHTSSTGSPTANVTTNIHYYEQ